VSDAALPDLMDLADVLTRLKGVICRTALLKHLTDVPVFAGGGETWKETRISG
jgi:hypothetical protein